MDSRSSLPSSDSQAESPLSILYEDEWLVAIDKPAGQLVHPADTPQEGDQVTMKILRDQIGKHVYTIHRLDRPTTGVLLFAKDQAVARPLHKALERHEFQKTYIAVCHGEAPESSWESHEPLQKSDDAPFKDAHTSFRTLHSYEHPALESLETSTLSLMEATPHTGRYHQIRRHLLLAGIPITGDYRHSGVEQSDLLGNLLGTGTRMLLQARKLQLTHPVTHDELTINAPVDSLIQRCFPSPFKNGTMKIY